MSRTKKDANNEHVGYNIKRVKSGYAVFFGNKQISEENVLSLTFKLLEKTIRKELGL